jgi:hypothetical protein
MGLQRLGAGPDARVLKECVTEPGQRGNTRARRSPAEARPGRVFWYNKNP